MIRYGKLNRFRVYCTLKVGGRMIDRKQETLNVESIQWHKSDFTHTFSSVAPGMLCSL